MSPSDQQKIRRATKRLHWFFQIAMILALIAIPFERDLRGMLGDVFTHIRLSEVANGVQREFVDFFHDRERELVAFLPPTDPAAREAWAASISEHIGEPSAVFLQQGGKVDWFTVPATCREALPQVETLLRNPADSLWRTNRPDTLGAMVIRRAYVERDSTHSTAIWQLGPLGDSLRWGTVQSGERIKLNLRAFYGRLQRAEVMPLLEPVARQLSPYLALERNVEQPRLATMRVTIDGEEIYRSPSLDTTAARHVEEFDGVRSEFYLGYADQQIRANLTASRASWRSFILPLLMMLTIYTLYRWIIKLTEPDAT